MTLWRVVVRGTVPVELPPERALHLFTPVGERLWAPGWEPELSGRGGRRRERAGTVFLTDADGARTHSVAVDRNAEAVR